MLELIVAALVIFWMLAMVTSTTMSGFVHVVLVVAIVVVLIGVLGG